MLKHIKNNSLAMKFKSIGMLSLTAVMAGSIAALAPVAAPAQAAPAQTCSPDSLYALSNLYDMSDTVQGQILEYQVDSNGLVDGGSWTPFSDMMTAKNKVPGQQVAPFDALGVSQDCSFYFVSNNNTSATPSSVDVYRYNPNTDSKPEIVQANMSMNSPTTGNVVAGAVAPNGEYYFGYLSRNTAADNSDAEGEVVRFHLYRYAFTPGSDPQAVAQPNERSGEVAHIDIAVDPEVFTNAAFIQLYGDLAFDADGNMILYTSYENPGFESNEQLSAVLPAAQFESIPGTWREAGAAKYLPVPRVDVQPTLYTQNAAQPVYMGTAYTGSGDMYVMSIGLTHEAEAPLQAVFNQLDVTTLTTIPGTESVSKIAVSELDPALGNDEARFYPFDLAGSGLATSFSASLEVSALVGDDDIFSMSVADQAGTQLGNTSTTPGALNAQLTLPVAPGTYTVTQQVSANADAYSTSWACVDAGGAKVAAGTGLVAEARVAGGTSVNCAFSNTVKAKLAVPENPKVSQAVRNADGSVIDPRLELATTDGIDYTLSNAHPKAGEKVTITATPQKGFALDRANLPAGWKFDSVTGTATFTVTLDKLPGTNTDGEEEHIDGAGSKPLPEDTQTQGATGLANTGAESAWLFGAAGALLLAGGTVMLLRRRAVK